MSDSAGAVGPASASPGDGFVRVEGGKVDEGADFVAVVSAYSIIAIIWAAFLALIWRRGSGAAGRLERGETALRRKNQAHFVE